VTALAVLDSEPPSPHANIVDFGDFGDFGDLGDFGDFGDAIWCAVTTMTSVGYGDRYPVTGTERLVGFGLMVCGIALLGTVTATLASWLVEAVAAEKQETDELRLTILRLEEKIDRLTNKQGFNEKADEF